MEFSQNLQSRMDQSFQQDPPKKKYDFVKVVGRGSYGEVFSAIGDDGVNYAIKRIPRKRLSYERLYQEIDACTKVNGCENIPKFHNASEDSDFYYLAFDFIEGIDLLAFAIKRGSFSESFAKKIFRKIVNTVSEIHSKRVIHNDLKLENIIYSETTLDVNIIDFGLSEILTGDDDTRFSNGGSYEYLSPEKIFSPEKGYSGFKSDVWSLGIILFAMIFGKFPWIKDQRKEYMETHKCHPPIVLTIERKKISNTLADLLSKILETDFKKRISLDEVKTHPWLQSD